MTRRRKETTALNIMLYKQGEFSRKVRDMVREREYGHDFPEIKDDNPDELVKWTKEYGLATMMEVTEVVDMLKWKPHREEHHYSTLDRDGIGEELIDVFNYTLAQFHMWGFSGDDVYQMWKDKFAVLEQRQYQEKDFPLRADEPVVMIDLDGCVADFRAGLIEYLKEKELIPNDAIDPCTKLNIDLDFGLDPFVYRKAKWDYESAGGYRTLPLMAGAAELIAEAQKHGRIVFITSRTVPLKRIYRDTLGWIKDHFPQLEFVLYVDDKKAERLAVSQCKVMLCVEDDPKLADRLLAAGHLVVMPKHPYNQKYREEGIIRQPNLWCEEPAFLWSAVRALSTDVME